MAEAALAPVDVGVGVVWTRKAIDAQPAFVPRVPRGLLQV